MISACLVRAYVERWLLPPDVQARLHIKKKKDDDQKQVVPLSTPSAERADGSRGCTHQRCVRERSADVTEREREGELLMYSLLLLQHWDKK